MNVEQYILKKIKRLNNCDLTVLERALQSNANDELDAFFSSPRNIFKQYIFEEFRAHSIALKRENLSFKKIDYFI